MIIATAINGFINSDRVDFYSITSDSSNNDSTWTLTAHFQGNKVIVTRGDRKTVDDKMMEIQQKMNPYGA